MVILHLKMEELLQVLGECFKLGIQLDAGKREEKYAIIFTQLSERHNVLHFMGYKSVFTAPLIIVLEVVSEILIPYNNIFWGKFLPR